MKIGVLNTAKGGVGLYRVVNPHKGLMKDSTVVFLNNYTVDEPLDIIFAHASVCISDDAVRFLLSSKNSGLKIVIDVDDYWVLPSTHPLFHLNVNNNYVNRHIAILKLADLVTTTTTILAKKVIAHNKNVVVLPNSLNHDMVNFEKDPYFDTDKFKIGWIGGSTHLDDIKLIDKSKLMSRLDKINAQFILSGFNISVRNSKGEIKDDPQNSVWVKYESILTNRYEYTNVAYTNFLLKYEKNKMYHDPSQSYIRRWSKDEKKYLSLYKDLDLVLAPLQKDMFNEHKSELKIVEAGWNKKPIIASDMPQYRNILSKGGGVLIDNSRIHKDLWTSVLEYKNNPSKLQDDGEKLYEICVSEFNMDKINKLRYEAYSSLL